MRAAAGALRVLRPRVRGYAGRPAEALPPVPAVLPGRDTVRGGEGGSLMAWFRLYTDVAHDPKVQRLSPAIFKFWITILCLAKENGGIVPPLSDVSFVSHRRQSRVQTDIATLAAAGLLDATPDGLVPHNWAGRQYKSDDVTARVKRFRERSKVVTGNAPETETETETDSAPSDRALSAPPKERFFKTENVGKRVAAMVDEAKAHNYELNAGHVGKMLAGKKHGPGQVWDALVKAIGDKVVVLDTSMEATLNGYAGKAKRGNAGSRQDSLTTTPAAEAKANW